VVVDDLNVSGSGIGPAEAEPPLLVDADAVLPSSIAAELLEPVGWRHSEVVQRCRTVEHGELDPCSSLKFGMELRVLTQPYTFGLVIGEGADHTAMLTPGVSNARRLHAPGDRPCLPGGEIGVVSGDDGDCSLEVAAGLPIRQGRPRQS